MKLKTNNIENEFKKLLNNEFLKSRENLLPALHLLHENSNYLPEWGMKIIGWHLKIPLSEVFGAATSYTEFTLEKPNENSITICTGVSCWINGGEELANQIKLNKNINENFVTKTTPCAFMCSMGPLAKFKDKWIGRTNINKLSNIIR